jgi:hypothetical protein
MRRASERRNNSSSIQPVVRLARVLRDQPLAFQLASQEISCFPVACDNLTPTERSYVEGLLSQLCGRSDPQCRLVDTHNIPAERARDNAHVLIGRKREVPDELPGLLQARAP